MKITVIGANGTIGKGIVELLASKRDILKAGFTRGEILVDLASPDSIQKFLKW